MNRKPGIIKMTFELNSGKRLEYSTFLIRIEFRPILTIYDNDYAFRHCIGTPIILMSQKNTYSI